MTNDEILKACITQALQSSCLRSKCGSIIIFDNIVVGKGFNSPPQNICLKKCFKDELPSNFKSDKTCCVHAEQRSIIDTLIFNPRLIVGSSLYFVRLDNQNMPLPSGDPYCTICSKLALDVGVEYFCLWNGFSFTKYKTDIYNQLSFNYENNRF